MSVALSNLTLKHLVEELNFLTNGYVNKVQTLDNGWIKIKVHTKEFGDKNVIITPSVLFVSKTSLNAKQNPGGFSALLKKYLFNQRIISIKQHSLDRIVVFQFPGAFLIVELFAKGNLILCDKDMKIIKAMRKEEWKDRKLERNEVYKFPSSKGISPLKIDEKKLEELIKNSGKSFFGACVDSINTAPLILEKIFSDFNIDKKKEAMSTKSNEIELIAQEIKKIYSAKPTKPFIYESVIYTTDIGKEKQMEFESINSALNAIFIEQELGIVKNELEAKSKTQNLQKILDEINSKNKLIEELKIKENQAQTIGEKIYLNYQKLNQVLNLIKHAETKNLREEEILALINDKEQIATAIDTKNKKIKINLH